MYRYRDKLKSEIKVGRRGRMIQKAFMKNRALIIKINSTFIVTC